MYHDYINVCVSEILPKVRVKNHNMLWKQKCVFKGEKNGSREIKALLCYKAEVEREQQGDQTFIPPSFVPVTFGVIGMVLLEKHGCYQGCHHLEGLNWLSQPKV